MSSIIALIISNRLVDLVVLAGCYHTVCGLLNMFAVPVPGDATPAKE
jgi:hypothetical protein